MNGYLLLHQATKAVREDASFPMPVPASGTCTSCLRSFGDVEEPEQWYAFTASYPGSPEHIICSTCASFRAPAPSALGVARYVRSTPVYATLSVNNGCVLLASHEEGGKPVLHVGTKAGNKERYEKGCIAEGGRLHYEDAWPLLVRLLSERVIATPFVFIAETGKKAMDLAGVRVTEDLREVWVNATGTQSYPVDLLAMQALAHACDDQGLTDVAAKPAFWKPIRDHAKGMAVTKQLEKWADKVPDPAGLLIHLPDDPHARGLIHALVPLFLGKEPINANP